MKQTTNYKFKKPELTDSPPDITVLNENFDIIDEKLFAVIKAWEEFKANGGSIGGDLTPVKNNEMSLGNEHYKFKDIFIGNFSKTPNGYTKLPNGLILQWGIINVEFKNGNISTISTVQFPIIFPNNVVHVGTEAIQISPSGIPLAKINTGSSERRTNLFNVQAFSTAGELKHTVAVGWIAIGY